MTVLSSNSKTFLVSYNPNTITFIENKGGQKVTVFYSSMDRMPASVRASFASRMQRRSR